MSVTSKVVVGQEVTLMRGRREKVKEPCEVKDNGAWFCVTHKKGFPNQFALDTHIRAGTHQLAWICNDHGAEVP